MCVCVCVCDKSNRSGWCCQEIIRGSLQSTSTHFEMAIMAFGVPSLHPQWREPRYYMYTLKLSCGLQEIHTYFGVKPIGLSSCFLSQWPWCVVYWQDFGTHPSPCCTLLCQHVQSPKSLSFCSAGRSGRYSKTRWGSKSIPKAGPVPERGFFVFRKRPSWDDPSDFSG